MHHYCDIDTDLQKLKIVKGCENDNPILYSNGLSLGRAITQ